MEMSILILNLTVFEFPKNFLSVREYSMVYYI